MFTRDELRAVPLLSRLADADLDYLASTSADIRLVAGEYIVHEGETRRAFFVVIEGHVEVTKVVEGMEIVVGTRRGPGDTFGEIPVILDTPSLVNFRAIEPSRVMQIDSKDFHAVAASSPGLSSTITATALERVEGLQEIAATPSQPLLAVIGAQWDRATFELRDFLERNSVDFDWIAPGDFANASAPLPSLEDRYPVVRLRDGSVLRSPSLRDVAEAIGLSIVPDRPAYDLAIVGGGPAGLAAAVYGASEGLSTILLEKEAPGGQAGTSSRIENYLGFPFGISGRDLARRALQQAKRLGAEIVVTRTIEGLDPESRTLLFDGNDTVRAKSVLLAMGVSWRTLDVPSLERLRGRGVYYGAAPGEARFVQGKDVYLVGGGNSAGQAAVHFSNFAKSVTLLVRGDSLAASMSYYLVAQLETKKNVHVETRCEVVAAYGEDHLESLGVMDNVTAETSLRDAAALFVLIGADAKTDWLPGSVARDSRGYVLTGPDVQAGAGWSNGRAPYFLETTVPGIFAVGDVRAGSVKRVAAGVGEGSMAIAFVHRYLAEGNREQ